MDWLIESDIAVKDIDETVPNTLAVLITAFVGILFAFVSLPMSENWFNTGALEQVFDTEWITDEHFYLAHRAEEQQRPEVAELIQWLISEFQHDG